MRERNVAMRVLYALCLGMTVACNQAEGDPRLSPTADSDPRKAGGPEGPLVVELFTSQGCSSCPPADALLSKLASTGTLADRTLAPLTFHVDYWNDLGWADPFSSPAWTERQRQYSRSMGDDRVYTPEIVVGGAKGVVGSNMGAVMLAIQQAAHPALLPATGAWAKDSLTVTATAPADADVWVAVWEDGTATRVLRGENSGETLGSDRVVRHLQRVATAGQKTSAAIQIDPKWHAGGAVAFAQRSDRKIVASALLKR